ncbi:hypothetical protein O0555_21020 [Brevibacillus laterosporus]|uniref:hypothetical protein n=1 Tax=Brevibacillus laterosporus TaxID=1465 RepID=UPI00215C1292|nr:hypothetical protein [Brevibacillus laterosporus]MCR8939785.1 hypothetical protein [Brevibacillus laterosporus]MCZ0842425.1 hypothetical protein [Brevibacillus laterosporus]MCZ0846422.1 hypothetical protein [Brevibacillus laterosporus]
MGQNYVGLDLSTKTGFVRLDEQGNVLEANEITLKDLEDPERMSLLAEKILSEIQPTDFVLIEGFSFNSSGRSVDFQYGIGWFIRVHLYRRGMKFVVVAPSQLKKFATGKGVGDKAAVAVGIAERFGFKHKSDNVRDAYVLAQIGRALNGHGELIKPQKEVVEAIFNPKPKTKAKAKK